MFGTSYQIDAIKVVGLFGGYEGFNYTDATLAQLSGTGLTIGSFVAGTFNEKLKLDARAYTTFLNYTILNGATSGAFTAQRVALTTTAGYELGFGPLSVAPFMRGSALFEWQSAYTDSVATVHTAQYLAQGILAPGVKLSRMIGMSNGSTLTPFISAEANFIFGNTILPGFNGTQGIAGQIYCWCKLAERLWH